MGVGDQGLVCRFQGSGWASLVQGGGCGVEGLESTRGFESCQNIDRVCGKFTVKKAHRLAGGFVQTARSRARSHRFEIRVWCLRFGVWGLGFRFPVSGSGFRFRVRFSGFGVRVAGSEFRFPVSGFGFWVLGFMSRVSGVVSKHSQFGLQLCQHRQLLLSRSRAKRG